MPVSVQLLLIFVMAIFANVKVYFGSSARIDNTEYALKFNSVVFGVVGCAFLVFVVGQSVSKTTVISSVAYAAASVIFQIFYVIALDHGPISIVVLLANLATVPAAIGGALIFKEGFQLTQIIGLTLTAVSMVFTMKSGRAKKSNKGYVYGVIAMFASSVALLIQRYHQKTEFANERNRFLCIAYLFAAVMALIVLLIIKRLKKGTESTAKKNYFGLGVGAGLALVVYQFLLIYLSGKATAMLMYPALAGLTTIMNVIMCVTLFKEKVSRRQLIGLAVGAVAIVIMSL